MAILLLNKIVCVEFWVIVWEHDDDDSSFNVAKVKLTVNVSATWYWNIIGLPFFSYNIDNERSNDEPYQVNN